MPVETKERVKLGRVPSPTESTAGFQREREEQDRFFERIAAERAA